MQDTGVGIAEEDMEKLFNRFGKLQRTAKMNSEGIGLGLTIVKQIVELTGGEIKVYSGGVGRGSTFGFRMPMRAVQVDESSHHEPKSKVMTEQNESFDSPSFVDSLELLDQKHQQQQHRNIVLIP